MNIQTVAVKVDRQDEMRKGYNCAAKLLEQRKMVSVIPYVAPSGFAVGYCQAIIDYCQNQQAIGARLYTE